MSILLSVVIPMYNEEKLCEKTAQRLVSCLSSFLPEDGFEILFANDGSRDTCAEKIAAFSEKEPRVRLCGYPDNRGKGSAIRTGVLASKGERVLYTDCDLAYGTDLIREFYETSVKTGSDLVIGSRRLAKDGYEGYSFLRRLMSRTYLLFLRLMTGFSYSDSQCGIKCLRGEVARSIFSECQINGFAFDLEMLLLADRRHCTVTEHAAKIIDNRPSESKINPVRDAIRMMKDVSRMKKLHKKEK